MLHFNLHCGNHRGCQNFMDSDMKTKSLQLPVDSMDFLSQVWCNTAIQVMQPAMEDRSLALQDDLIKMIKNDLKVSPVSLKSLCLPEF